MTAQMTHTTDFPMDGKPFELVLTSSKGHGLFATENIPRGIRVFEESPILTSPSLSAKPGAPVFDIKALLGKLNSLTPQQHDNFFDLCHDPRDAKAAKARIHKEVDSMKRDCIKHRIPDDRQVEAIIKLQAIYQTNAAKLGEGDKSGTGVFPSVSRINHSCNANLQIHYIPTTQKLLVHAVRHINKGEELTTNYLLRSYKPCEERNDMLDRRWGFECACRVCNGTPTQVVASDGRRTKMSNLDTQLVGYDLWKEKGWKHILKHASSEQALQKAEDILELCRAEGITDRGLQHAYRRCSKYSLQAGLFDKAVNYAKKERDVERYCIGADTAQLPHLEKNLKGAEFWLKHVQDERQKDRANQKWLEEELAREATPKSKKSNKRKGR